MHKADLILGKELYTFGKLEYLYPLVWFRAFFLRSTVHKYFHLYYCVFNKFGSCWKWDESRFIMFLREIITIYITSCFSYSVEKFWGFVVEIFHLSGFFMINFFIKWNSDIWVQCQLHYVCALVWVRRTISQGF